MLLRLSQLPQGGRNLRQARAGLVLKLERPEASCTAWGADRQSCWREGLTIMLA